MHESHLQFCRIETGYSGYFTFLFVHFCEKLAGITTSVSTEAVANDMKLSRLHSVTLEGR